MPAATRRLFLKTAALASAAAALHACGRRGAARPADVAIVGAGMAGLVAARDLADAGMDVVVLEARERSGGRIQTLHEPSPHGLEIGAQMIHGSRAPTWNLVRELGLEARPLPSWETWKQRPGGGFDSGDGGVGRRAESRLAAAYHEYRGDDVPYARFLDDLRFTADERDAVAEHALSWSAEPDEVSLRAAMEDEAVWEAYLDRNYQVVGGYDQIPAALHRTLGERVRLSTPVESIAWDGGGVTLTCSSASGPVTKVRAERALVTVPIGVLQAGLLRFDPPLPAWKQAAVAALRMGRVVVVHFLFDEPFWRQVPGLPGWHTQGGRVSFWDPHRDAAGAPVLLGWITGLAAQELSDRGEEAGRARALSWIEAAFPRARAARRVAWSSLRDWVRDPWSRGSYSFTLPGGAGQRAVLATPLHERLYFAGEATEAAPHYQTVHGAYASGRRAAREILASAGRDARSGAGLTSRGGAGAAHRLS